MKSPISNFKFIRPIGTVRDLGTAREWTTEIAGVALCIIVLVILYILS